VARQTDIKNDRVSWQVHGKKDKDTCKTDKRKPVRHGRQTERKTENLADRRKKERQRDLVDREKESQRDRFNKRKIDRETLRSRRQIGRSGKASESHIVIEPATSYQMREKGKKECMLHISGASVDWLCRIVFEEPNPYSNVGNLSVRKSLIRPMFLAVLLSIFCICNVYICFFKTTINRNDKVLLISTCFVYISRFFL
jgi:hypothetical protein